MEGIGHPLGAWSWSELIAQLLLTTGYLCLSSFTSKRLTNVGAACQPQRLLPGPLEPLGSLLFSKVHLYVAVWNLEWPFP